MSEPQSPRIVAFIDRLAETGSHYWIEEMIPMYTEDLGFVVLTPTERSIASRRRRCSTSFAAVATREIRRFRYHRHTGARLLPLHFIFDDEIRQRSRGPFTPWAARRGPPPVDRLERRQGHPVHRGTEVTVQTLSLEPAA
jgi:hypothetical protein